MNSPAAHFERGFQASPLVPGLHSESKDPHSPIGPATRWRAYIPVTLLAGLGVLLSISSFTLVSQSVEERAALELERRASDFTLALNQSIARDVEVLQHIVSLFDSSERVMRDEFRLFTQRALAAHPGIQALEWIPRVPHAARGAHEAAARADGLTGFSLREKGRAGGMVAAEIRDEYFPVYYVEPMQGNAAAVGFDLASNPVRSEALKRARDNAAPVTTGRITLVQETGEQFGFLIFVPVFTRGDLPQAVSERRERLMGFALGVYRVGDMVETILTGRVAQEFDIAVFDAAAEAGVSRLYYRSAQAHASPPPAPTENEIRSGRHLATELHLPGRTWTLYLRPATGAGWLQGHWQEWGALVIGLSFTVLLSVYLMSSMGRTRKISVLVAQRTEALSEANDRLEHEAEERKRTQTALAERADALEKSNAELEQFAYIASHDLQEPLRMVSSYTQLLSKRYRGKLDANADEFIHYAVDGAKRMQRLLQDLLDYSRVGSKGKSLVPTDSADVLAAACANLKTKIEAENADISAGPLPEVCGDDVQLTQVFQNLIGNALKFRGEEPASVRVEARADGDQWVFSIADNGIGLDAQYSERIFQVFQRLHTQTAYPGTGIGLAVCKKVIERHGGRIWVESEPGSGSTFLFSLHAVGK